MVRFYTVRLETSSVRVCRLMVKSFRSAQYYEHELESKKATCVRRRSMRAPHALVEDMDVSALQADQGFLKWQFNADYDTDQLLALLFHALYSRIMVEANF